MAGAVPGEANKDDGVTVGSEQGMKEWRLRALARQGHKLKHSITMHEVLQRPQLLSISSASLPATTRNQISSHILPIPTCNGASRSFPRNKSGEPCGKLSKLECFESRVSLSLGYSYDGCRQKTREIKCMAHPRRVQMVAKQIEREVGDMLVRDKVLSQAILPESAFGADMYLSSVTTVSSVVVSKDLQVAKIYVSILGDKKGQELAFKGLKSKEKYVRMQLGKRMQLRLTPEVRFIEDDSLERGTKVLTLLDKLKAERERKERVSGGMANDYDEHEEDKDEGEEDDANEGDEKDDGIRFEGENIIFVA